SAIINAVAPITGGKICPPTDAAASTAPEKLLEYPFRIIKCIYKDPVVTTFAIADPLIEPRKPLEMTATFAGPPEVCPEIAIAESLNNCPIPVRFKKAPNRTNRKIYVAETPMAVPKIPSVVRYIYVTTSSI